MAGSTSRRNVYSSKPYRVICWISGVSGHLSRTKRTYVHDSLERPLCTQSACIEARAGRSVSHTTARLPRAAALAAAHVPETVQSGKPSERTGAMPKTDHRRHVPAPPCLFQTLRCALSQPRLATNQRGPRLLPAPPDPLPL